MMRRVMVLSLIALILASSIAVSGEEKPGLKVGSPAPKFILKDAHDEEHSLEATLSKEQVKAVFLIIGDRKVREEGNKWARELHKLYGEKKEIAMFMIADLRDLPFFVTEGMVKWGTKREKLPITILLDWEGKVNKLYKTQKRKVDLFIIDKDCKVAYHHADKYSDELFKKFRAKVETIFHSQHSVVPPHD